jgi:hypothetical protein
VKIFLDLGNKVMVDYQNQCLSMGLWSRDQRARRLEYDGEDIMKTCIDALKLVQKHIFILCKNN